MRFSLRGNYTGNYGDHDRVWRGDVLLVHRRVSSGGDSAGASLPVYFRPVLSRANDAVPLSEYPFGTPMLAGVCELLSRMIGAPVLGHFFGFTGLCWINPIAWVTASGLLFLSYRKTMRNIRPVDPTVDASDPNKIMN